MSIGLIGGSGIYSLGLINKSNEIKIQTPYGNPSSLYLSIELGDKRVFFLNRHGLNHTIPPHKVNYRANIWGFKNLGVKKIISINAVGGINTNLNPGNIVLLDQIIDMTFGMRASTFFDGPEVAHVDFTEPFCSALREKIKASAKEINIEIIDGGVYVCVNGPRLETSAEIKFFAQIGASVVGMTLMPEASLSREAEMCFASIAIVTNMAAGISQNRLTVNEVIETMRLSNEQINKLLTHIINAPDLNKDCICNHALKDAFI
ncbi:MAG: S-methyl-5'-thioadenosine phosphorylase [Thermodesulfovibrionales bacterium]